MATAVLLFLHGHGACFCWEMTLHSRHTLRLRCDTFTGLQSKSSKISIDCIVAGTLCHNLSIALNMSDNEDQKPTDSAAGDQKGEPITIRVRDQVSLRTAMLTLNKKMLLPLLSYANYLSHACSHPIDLLSLLGD